MLRNVFMVATMAATIAVASSADAAPTTGGSDIVCSLTIRPFVISRRTGERIYLRSDRFVVETDSPEVIVIPETDVWMLRSETAVGTKVHYRVVDRELDQVILEDEAALFCGAGAPATSEPKPAPEPKPAQEPEPPKQTQSQPPEPSDPDLPRRIGMGFLFALGSASLIAGATSAAVLEEFELKAGVTVACMMAGAALLGGGFGLLYPNGVPSPQVAIVPTFSTTGVSVQLAGTF